MSTWSPFFIATAFATTLALAGPAQAAVMNVDTDGDDIAEDGQCSVREAVINANNNDQSGSTDCPAGEEGPGVVDRIQFDSSLGTAFIILDRGGPGENDAMEGDLDIHDDLTIVGNGKIDPDFPDGSATFAETLLLGSGDRAIDVPATDVTVTIEELMIVGGSDVDDGGGIHGSFASASMTLRNALVYDNHAQARGGGIWWAGELILENSAVFANTVAGTGSDNVRGGGIASNGDVTLVESVVFDNEAVTETGAARGGGLYIVGSESLTMTDTLIVGNSARTTGTDAALAAAAGAWISLPATVDRSGIIDNHAEGMVGASRASGGGLLVFEPTTITNSTIAGNRATSDTDSASRGGIGSNSSAVTLELNNVTVTTNSATSGDASRGTGGGIQRVAGSVTIGNSLVAGNTDSNGGYPDCRGTIDSSDYNLVANNSGCGFVAAANDQVGDVEGGGTAIDPGDVIDPAGPADNVGGFHVGDGFVPHLTVALTENSLALDSADPNDPEGSGSCETVDQRGASRPFDGDGDGTAICDIGAFERNTIFETFIFTDRFENTP